MTCNLIFCFYTIPFAKCDRTYDVAYRFGDVVLWVKNTFLEVSHFIILGSEICPVEIFKFYLMKLNNSREDLWQRPRAIVVDGNDPERYENAVIGRDPLNNIIKEISKNAKNFYHAFTPTIVSMLLQSLNSTLKALKHNILWPFLDTNQRTLLRTILQFVLTRKNVRCLMH